MPYDVAFETELSVDYKVPFLKKGSLEPLKAFWQKSVPNDLHGYIYQSIKHLCCTHLPISDTPVNFFETDKGKVGMTGNTVAVANDTGMWFRVDYPTCTPFTSEEDDPDSPLITTVKIKIKVFIDTKRTYLKEKDVQEVIDASYSKHKSITYTNVTKNTTVIPCVRKPSANAVKIPRKGVLTSSNLSPTACVGLQRNSIHAMPDKLTSSRDNQQTDDVINYRILLN